MADLPKGITSEEKFLYALATGDTSEMPEAITREEKYLKAIAENSGGGGGDAYTKAETDALLNNKQNVLTVGTNLDDEPIEDSTNPITSGGVYNTVGNIDAALDSLIMSLEPKTITANGTYNPADDGVTDIAK